MPKHKTTPLPRPSPHRRRINRRRLAICPQSQRLPQALPHQPGRLPPGHCRNQCRYAKFIRQFDHPIPLNCSQFVTISVYNSGAHLCVRPISKTVNSGQTRRSAPTILQYKNRQMVRIRLRAYPLLPNGDAQNEHKWQ